MKDADFNFKAIYSKCEILYNSQLVNTLFYFL